VRESRAAVQRWIEHGRVLVDGHPGRASAKVPRGATIEVHPELPPASNAAPDASVIFTVVFEDAHLLVVDKPAGLVVHPARGHEDGTLVNGLLARGGFERAPIDPGDPAGHLRPGIVHRLDKGTSGLLVVAKEARAREALKALFAKHDIEREYLAIVVGQPEDARIETLHARHPTDRLRFTSRVNDGRRAVTELRVVERLGPCAVVACRLETGRTHQIRVHLTEQAKAPILGDPLYGKRPEERAPPRARRGPRAPGAARPGARLRPPDHGRPAVVRGAGPARFHPRARGASGAAEPTLSPTGGRTRTPSRARDPP
jgi:23S rRNA pseudouridine1911/1915/1917 synthase